MQPKMCCKCKKNVAVIFITKVENGVTLNEGYCIKCARTLGIPQIDQAVKQMVQAIRNTDAYLEYRRQLDRIKEQPELKKQIDDFRTKNFELQTSKDTNFDKIDQFTRENEAFRENPLVSDFLAAELAFCRMMQEIGLYVTDQMKFE